MASLPQPMVYYPTSSSSIMHAQPASAAASRGSFGPVFAVLAVISFLAIAACVVGRLCGRRLSKKKYAADQDFYGSNAVGGDLEKGFEIKYPAMKPVASSRAVIHDIDDGFEIKFAPGKPAAWKNDSKADNKGRHQPQLGMPKGYAVPKEYAGFRYPAEAVVRQGQIRGGAFIPGKPST
ncbi:hypothetical protein ACP70R_027660 [Stipagrostis hirtigluma subsp. patula]